MELVDDYFFKLTRLVRKRWLRSLARRNAKRFRESAPAQLHDLFLLSSLYTDDSDLLLRNLFESQEEHDPRKEDGRLFPKHHDAGPRFVNLVTEIVENFKLTTIVETGVAHGTSTKAILSSLDKLSATGVRDPLVLHSIDIDERTQVQEFTGHSKWVFHLVSIGNPIEKILADIGEIDMFLHDSDHSYSHQMREYELAWKHLRPGGFLCSDDVSWSNAFLDFCQRVQLSPVIFSEAPKVAGFIRKPLP